MCVRQYLKGVVFAAGALYTLNDGVAAAVPAGSVTSGPVADVAVTPARSGKATIVAEASRALVLERGSNFRDLGGYQASDGKHVRWGLIYRSGGLALLSDADVGRVKRLGIEQVIDLRSSEERIVAPDRLDGVPYTAIGYSMNMFLPKEPATADESFAHLYRVFPVFFVPHLRLIFSALLQNSGPVVYHCSGGQDRTGFVSAMILSALRVPKNTIYDDYLLSPKYRRPQFEIPQLNSADYPQSSPMRTMAQAQQDPKFLIAQSLQDSRGPYLRQAFEEIDRRWGSVEQYLRTEIGLTSQDLARLRRIYMH